MAEKAIRQDLLAEKAPQEVATVRAITRAIAGPAAAGWFMRRMADNRRQEVLARERVPARGQPAGLYLKW